MLNFVGIYTEFADGVVRRFQKRGEMPEIWRAKVELQLLNEVGKADIPTEHKLDWYKTVLDASDFDPYWASISTRYNLPEGSTAPLSLFREEGEEEAEEEIEDGVEDDADDELDADADSEAGESEDEDEEDVEEDVELQDEIPVEGQDDLDGRSTVTDRQPRVLSPDSDSESWASDDDPRDHPLFFTRIRKAFPAKLCDICDSTSHTTERHPEFDWADWESDSSGGSVTKHKAKTYGKVLFVGLEPRLYESIDDWDRRLDLAQEDPCTTWCTMNPRAEIEMDDEVWEDSPYGCECRHRKRRGTESTAPQQHVAAEDPPIASAEGAGDEYETPPSSSKAKGKAPVSNTVKSTSKPKGFMKQAPTQSKRKEPPPPLKLVEAAAIPAQASRDAEGSGARVQGYASPPPERGQGLKRMLDEYSADEEEGPPAKKLKPPPQGPGHGVKTTLADCADDEEEGPPATKLKPPPPESGPGHGKKRMLDKDSSDSDEPLAKRAKTFRAAVGDGGRKEPKPPPPEPKPGDGKKRMLDGYSAGEEDGPPDKEIKPLPQEPGPPPQEPKPAQGVKRTLDESSSDSDEPLAKRKKIVSAVGGDVDVGREIAPFKKKKNGKMKGSLE